MKIQKFFVNYAASIAWCFLAIAPALLLESSAAAFSFYPTLSVSKTGTGSGYVKSSPTGISCGNVCSARYYIYTKVTLTATPNAGSVFTRWSGACSGTSTVTSYVPKGSSVVCTASFALSTAPAPTPSLYSLSISKAGTGTVTSNPAGISCGTACTASYASNTNVTLSAVPNTGSSFGGWSGSCAGTTTSTSVIVNANSSCVATFNTTTVPQYSLTVTRSGTGSGTVTSNPAGISCGSVCSYSYAQKTAVTLSASATAGSTFTGWSGSCAGTTTTASIVLSASSICFATFNTTPSPTGTASLAWDAVTSTTISGYRVYYGTTVGKYNQAPGQGLNAGAVTTYSLSGLSSGTRYYFAVTAIDALNAESNYSNEIFKDMQ